MDEREAKYLVDAANACHAITEFVEGKSLSQYKRDRLLRSAVERQLEILGEALSRLDNLAPNIVRTILKWEIL